MRRRTFLELLSLAGAGTLLRPRPARAAEQTVAAATKPVVICTWDFGASVTETAFAVLKGGGAVLDAVERAVRIPEADPKVTSVGRFGMPDRDGRLTLDAAIMDGEGNCGSVVFLEHIAHPISVARMVMEKTPHVMLAGEGALQFALTNGFAKEELLSDNAKQRYREWLRKSNYAPPRIDKDNHDTIGLLALDGHGNMAGACTTSGAAWKMHGRVGDSPLIGAGLYVDSDIGAATATGLGEAVIKVAGSFLVVELMRRGTPPQDACRLALERIVHKQPKYKAIDEFLVGFVALRKDGATGAMSYRKGMQYSLNTDGTNRVFDAPSIVT